MKLVPNATLSRRAFLKTSSLWVAGAGIASGLRPLNALADIEERSSPFVRRVMAPNALTDTHFTYPHSNGFLPDGHAVLAQPFMMGDRNAVAYHAFDMATGASRPLVQVSTARTYYAISRNGLMAVPRTASLVIVDLTQPTPTAREIFNEQGWVNNADLDISTDGTKVLATRKRKDGPEAYQLYTVDVATGAMEVIPTPGWPVDHAHFSPYDPSWICFAHNVRDPHELVPDRMWAWNPTQAPRGRNIFNQRLMPDGRMLVVSHERAMFHKPAMLTIAHGSSKLTPRGLYEAGFDGSSRLVSESNRDMHCNISRDGKWAVVSLEGPEDPAGGRPPATWNRSEGSYGVCDVQLVQMRTGRRAFLFRGTTDQKGQPYEVQPTISPDGRWVIVNDARARQALALEIDQQALAGFLAAG